MDAKKALTINKVNGRKWAVSGLSAIGCWTVESGPSATAPLAVITIPNYIHGEGCYLMLQVFVAAVGILVLILMSLRADRRFAKEPRLPMQWSFSGGVNWTAPRRLALAFTPFLAIFILSATVVSTIVFKPRPGQEGFEVPVISFLALAFIGAHALHLWLVNKHLERNDS
jgi:hypothetical protein